MCLHYLVKLIARVLSPYITYFSVGYRLWTFGIKFSLTVETTVLTVNNCFRRVYWHEKSCRRRSTTRGRLQMLKNLASASWTSGNVLISALEWSKRLRACDAAEGGQFEHELWLLVQQCFCKCALWLCRLIVWLLITFSLTVFSVFWLFQSHAAVVKRNNAVTPNKITSANHCTISAS